VSVTDQAVRFAVLGPVEVVAGDVALPVPGALRRGLLALLLLHANEVVGHQQIVEGLWGPTPPATARAQVRAAVAALRGVLGQADAADLLATRPAGYLLATAPDCLDLIAFRSDVDSARRAMAWQDQEEAARGLRGALGRWRGAALTGAVGFFVDASRGRLEEQRLAATEELAAAELALGRHAELIPMLTELVRQHPLRERMCQHLALALHRSGRTAEALMVVRRLREILAEEHGLDPGGEVLAVETAILRGHADLDPPDPAPLASPIVRPAQLPPESGHFIGRDHELTELDAVDPAGDAARPILVISGPAGVGKTALALRWAHGRRGKYPDGQLFLDLRGHRRDTALPVADALRHLVCGLGVPPERCPAEPIELAGLFRSLSDDRRILVLLDNAASSEQVVALLPGSATCDVVVTSRRRLDALAASARTHQLILGPLPRDDSVRLLRTVAGSHGPEPELAARLADGCGDFPLALRIVAARLVNRPDGAAADFVARLTSRPDRIAELTLEGGSLGVRKAFGSTYADLSPDAARLFRLFALTPYRHLGLDHAVAMSGLPAAAARAALDELAGLHLLVESGGGRYGAHDLVRSYAYDQALADEPPASRARAMDRLIDYVLAGAAAANRLITPDRQRVRLDVVAPAGTTPPGDRHAALAWLDAELAGAIAVARCAAEYGRPEAAWQIAYLVSGYCTLRGRYVEQAEACRYGLPSVTATGSPLEEAAVRQCLGVAYLSIRRFDDALDQVERGLALFEAAGEESGASRARNNIGVIHRLQQRFPEALAVYEQALARHGDARTDNVAVLLNNIGEVYKEMGERTRAVSFLERALAVRVELGDRYGEGVTLLNLGEVLLDHGDTRAAALRLGVAVAELRAAGDRYAQAEALTQLGEAGRRLGEYGDALRHLRAALVLRAEMDDRHGEAATRTVLAATLLDTGNLAAARLEADLVRDLRLTHPDPFEPARDRALLADLIHRLDTHTDRIRNP
jgi:DNA-binding SARP family transcriptional activator/tetratricopeptide (TPR) repeat protein